MQVFYEVLQVVLPDFHDRRFEAIMFYMSFGTFDGVLEGSSEMAVSDGRLC
jgi:hypothetical protein